jgi:parallel beta-helix repeat protein
VGLAAAALTTAAPAANASAADCDKVGSPGPGAAQRLFDSLTPGQTGCLHGGRYSENVRVNRGGTSDSNRITVRSFPGERAALHGRFYVPDESNFVTLEQLDFNGHDSPMCGSSGDYCQLPSPTVNGDDIVFQDNDVTNDHSGICFSLGSTGWGTAERVIIRRNRIHDCGRMPATNHDHGIYLSDSEHVQILGNVIYDNADRGIQLYPAADNTVVRGNVIDSNGQGVIFSGDGGQTSDNNLVENNVITNARIRFNVESWYPTGTGTGNVARNNCLYNGRQGNVGAQDGFVATRNLIADPEYVDRGGKDFRLKDGSPCAAVLAGAEVPAAPLDPTSRPGGETNVPVAAPADNGGDDQATPEQPTTTKPGSVKLENVSVKRGSRGRSRVRVAGKVTGGGPTKLRVQVRRGGTWKTIGIVPNVNGTFRVVLRARASQLRSAGRMTVRVVVPGLDASNQVRARTVR